MKKKMKAILSYLMIFAMVISMLPAMSVKAEGEDYTDSLLESYVEINLNGGYISGEFTWGDSIEGGVCSYAEIGSSIKEGLSIETLGEPSHDEGLEFLGWMVCTAEETEEGWEYIPVEGTEILTTDGMLKYKVPDFDIAMVAQWSGSFRVHTNDVVTVTANGDDVESEKIYALPESGSVNFIFKQKEDIEEKFTGITVYNINNQENVASIRADENGVVEYTLPDNTMNYSITAIDGNTAYDSEYGISYSRMNNEKVLVNGSFIDPDEFHSFEVNEELNFSFEREGEPVYPYAIIVRRNEDGSTLVEEVAYEETSFTYTPESDDAFEIMIYWSEDHYNYDKFEIDDESEIIFTYYVDGAGSVTPVDNHEMRSVTHDNNTKIALPKGTTEIQLNISGNLKKVLYEDNEVSLDDYKDGVFTLQLNEEEWTRAEFVFPDKAPGFKVWYDNDYIQVTDEEGNEIESDLEYEYESSEESVTLNFTYKNPEEGSGIYGIIVYQDDQEYYIKNTDNPYSMTYKITDMDSFSYIDVIDWIRPFDNEFMLSYSNQDIYSVKVNENIIEAYEIYDFEPGSPINFDFTQSGESVIPYALELTVNGEEQEIIFQETDSYTYTPESDRGFELKVYWTEDEYNFENLYNDEDEVMIWCASDGNGIVLPVEDENMKSASYNGNAKIVVPKSETSVDIQVIPGEGEELLGIFVRGEEVLNPEIEDGIYTFEFDSSEETWYNLDFNFSGGYVEDEEMPTYTLLDGNGGEVSFDCTIEEGDTFKESGKLFSIPVYEGMKVGEFCNSIGLEFDSVEKECSELTGWKVYRSDDVFIDLFPADEELNFGDEDNKIILFDSIEEDGVKYNVYMSFISVELIDESMSTEDLFNLDGDKNYYAVANWEDAHKPADAVRENEVPETCTEDGYYEEVVYCADCSKELSREEVIIEAPGHKYPLPILYTIDKMATCTEGAVLNVRCEVCQEKHPTLPEITTWELGHNHKRVVTKATTSKNGSIKYICDRDDCGHVDEDRTEVINKPSKMTLSTTTYVYDGKVKTPSVTVKDSKGVTLKKNTDYTVTYASGRKNVGKYAVKVTFKGNYSGTLTQYLTINPKGTSMSSVSKASKAFTAKWKKQSTQVTGYQIQYSTSKSFKSAKTVTVSSYKTTSKKVTKLKAKTTYYVRVRTYKTVGSTKFYSSWSTAKSVKTK